jgi:hypothetical protein
MKVASPFADADGFSALNRGYAGYLSADESAFDFALGWHEISEVRSKTGTR